MSKSRLYRLLLRPVSTLSQQRIHRCRDRKRAVNAARFCLASIAAVGLCAGGVSVVAAGEGPREQTLIAQNDAKAEAERLLNEGMRWYREGTAASLRQAIGLWERAGALFEEIGDRAQQATLLNNIGLAYYTLAEFHLPAELVVLSACQTGLGDNVRGEGLIGLTRGFRYAGARGSEELIVNLAVFKPLQNC